MFRKSVIVIVFCVFSEMFRESKDSIRTSCQTYSKVLKRGVFQFCLGLVSNGPMIKVLKVWNKNGSWKKLHPCARYSWLPLPRSNAFPFTTRRQPTTINLNNKAAFRKRFQNSFEQTSNTNMFSYDTVSRKLYLSLSTEPINLHNNTTPNCGVGESFKWHY